jgi:hypothetical protein
MKKFFATLVNVLFGLGIFALTAGIGLLLAALLSDSGIQDSLKEAAGIPMEAKKHGFHLGSGLIPKAIYLILGGAALSWLMNGLENWMRKRERFAFTEKAKPAENK